MLHEEYQNKELTNQDVECNNNLSAFVSDFDLENMCRYFLFIISTGFK